MDTQARKDAEADAETLRAMPRLKTVRDLAELALTNLDHLNSNPWAAETAVACARYAARAAHRACPALRDSDALKGEK